MEKRQRTRLASAAVVAVVFASGALVGMAAQRWMTDSPTLAEAPQAPFDGPRGGGPGGGGNRGRSQPRPMLYHQVLTPEQTTVADSLVRVMEGKRDVLERAFRRDMDSIFDASARPEQHRQDRVALITQLRTEIRGLMTPEQLGVYDSLIAADEARRRTEREQREQQQGQREGPGRQGRSGTPPPN